MMVARGKDMDGSCQVRTVLYPCHVHAMPCHLKECHF
jgi:hypothetical protein